MRGHGWLGDSSPLIFNFSLFSELVEGVFKHWSSLTNWSPDDEGAQYLFSLIDAMVVKKEVLEKLNAEDKSPVFLWLINNLLREKHFLTGGKEYFKSLTPFIMNSSEMNESILR